MNSIKNGCSMILFFALLIIIAGFGLNLDLNGEVTGVKVSVSPSGYTGNCPKLFKFTGNIMLKKGKVGEYRYRWVRSDGTFGPVKGGKILRNGSVIVTSQWLLGGNGKVYKNRWKQIQILPNHYDIGSSPSYIRPLLTSNKAFFTLNCRQVLAVDRDQDNRTVNNRATRVLMPAWEISGRISPKPAGTTNNLEGRKVRIILRREASGSMPVRITRHVYTLDSSSSYNYKFKSPFITAGTYLISIEKGPTATAPHSNNLNICFRGAEPERRTVTLTSSRKKVLNQDFKIEYTIQWGGGQPLCW